MLQICLLEFSSKKFFMENEYYDEYKWKYLEHCGLIFPQEYLYIGLITQSGRNSIFLTKEHEEIAIFNFDKQKLDGHTHNNFSKNFLQYLKKSPSMKLSIQKKKDIHKLFDELFFNSIYEYRSTEKLKKKSLSIDDNNVYDDAREMVEEKFKCAMVDAQKENLGNYRVEPPSLFKGRGDHPKLGTVKDRIKPENIVLNMTKSFFVPECSVPKGIWSKIYRPESTWLACWKDQISKKANKYIFLDHNSSFKHSSDVDKYENARKLKYHIKKIRKKYHRAWESRNVKKQQLGVGIYFIDILALRAGHEKDDDEADTVGCCSLKISNVEVLSHNKIKFDFIGKDSIRYENTVRVDEKVHELLRSFMKERLIKVGQYIPKGPDDLLFDQLNTFDLNSHLKKYMDCLSAKVFRTYNASVTLERILNKHNAQKNRKPKNENIQKSFYEQANKKVAILCNHQRSLPGAYIDLVFKKCIQNETSFHETEELYKEINVNLKNSNSVFMGQDSILTDFILIRDSSNEGQLDGLKTIALGTSKINYMDPRITVSWCKRLNVPIELIFKRSLLCKFGWAMKTTSTFVFFFF
jgi:DNA topoisomerase-1